MAWDWVFFAVASVFVLVVVLLAIPVEATFRVDRRDETRVKVVIGWFAGRVGHVLVSLPKDEGPDGGEEDVGGVVDEGEEEGAVEEGPGETVLTEGEDVAGAWEMAQPGLALVRSEGFLGHVVGWVRRTLASFTLRRFAVWARFGTGDPADTGELFGRFQAVLPPVYASRRVSVELTPEFDSAVFEAGGAMTLRARPLRLVWEGLVFLFSPVMFRALLAAWRARPDA